MNARDVASLIINLMQQYPNSFQTLLLEAVDQAIDEHTANIPLYPNNAEEITKLKKLREKLAKAPSEKLGPYFKKICKVGHWTVCENVLLVFEWAKIKHDSFNVKFVTNVIEKITKQKQSFPNYSEKILTLTVDIKNNAFDPRRKAKNVFEKYDEITKSTAKSQSDSGHLIQQNLNLNNNPNISENPDNLYLQNLNLNNNDNSVNPADPNSLNQPNSNLNSNISNNNYSNNPNNLFNQQNQKLENTNNEQSSHSGERVIGPGLTEVPQYQPS